MPEHNPVARFFVLRHSAEDGDGPETEGLRPDLLDRKVPLMNAPATCPCCGVVVMPTDLSYDYDGETVASLTREVAYLRATVARLRGAPIGPSHARITPTAPAPRRPGHDALAISAAS